MISTKATRIWTPFGYLFVDDLYVGEKVISFNPERGVCEYDEIKSIQMEYKSCMGYGLNSKSMRQLLTPDHPIMIWNFNTKELKRIPIEDRFMVSMPNGDKAILMHALFEPYKQSQDLEDIKWSARMAASVASHARAAIDIYDVTKDLGGYEAQLWLDTFFHWNRLVPMRNWMATVGLTNLEVRDIVFNIGPRAGVGIKSYRFRNKSLISMTVDGTVRPTTSSCWFKQPINEPVFNLTTGNGNVLARSSNGTYLLACNGQEEDVKSM
jgi:hypothetical protein